MKWNPIETAPKDGSEILGYRKDCGILLIRYTAPIDFMTDTEMENLDDFSAESYDWFCADFIGGERLDGDTCPTHWMPLPEPPMEVTE
jgi:hypothetical protein